MTLFMTIIGSVSCQGDQQSAMVGWPLPSYPSYGLHLNPKSAMASWPRSFYRKFSSYTGPFEANEPDWGCSRQMKTDIPNHWNMGAVKYKIDHIGCIKYCKAMNAPYYSHYRTLESLGSCKWWHLPWFCKRDPRWCACKKSGKGAFKRDKYYTSGKLEGCKRGPSMYRVWGGKKGSNGKWFPPKVAVMDNGLFGDLSK